MRMITLLVLLRLGYNFNKTFKAKWRFVGTNRKSNKSALVRCFMLRFKTNFNAPHGIQNNIHHHRLTPHRLTPHRLTPHRLTPHRLTVRLPIGLDFPLITLPFQGC